MECDLPTTNARSNRKSYARQTEQLTSRLRIREQCDAKDHKDPDMENGDRPVSGNPKSQDSKKEDSGEEDKWTRHAVLRYRSIYHAYPGRSLV